jgi:hypothetical protein
MSLQLAYGQGLPINYLMHYHATNFITVSPLGINRVRILLKWIIHIGCGDVNWNHLAESRNQWGAVVNTLTNLGVY